MLQTFPSVQKQLDVVNALLQDTFAVDRTLVRQIFMPYRIAPLGAHVDHQGGHVLGRVINAGTAFAYMPLPKPEIRLAATNFSDSANFDIGTAVQPDHWARYAQAAALALGQDHSLSYGLAGVSGGILIGAGLSSSAAVGLAYLQALADVNSISLTPPELVELDYQLEHNYLGLQNGILDQSSILYGRENEMLYINTLSGKTRSIPDPLAAGDVSWLIIQSGIARELTRGGGYNQRVAECRAAAQWLLPGAERLSNVPQELFLSHAANMPDNLRRRATHYYGEVARVADGIGAWQEGDIVRFGRLMNESCASSIHEYESGQEEIIALQHITSKTAGIYGSRFSGAGYGGCVIALADRGQADRAASRILQTYDQIYPTLSGKATVYLVEKGVIA